MYTCVSMCGGERVKSEALHLSFSERESLANNALNEWFII